MYQSLMNAASPIQQMIYKHIGIQPMVYMTSNNSMVNPPHVTDVYRVYTLDEYHEDYGDVLWWSFPIVESPYVGCPMDSKWPEYHTHWTAIPIPTEPVGN
jgi:hypothetical protein